MNTPTQTQNRINLWVNNAITEWVTVNSLQIGDLVQWGNCQVGFTYHTITRKDVHNNPRMIQVWVDNNENPLYVGKNAKWYRVVDTKVGA